MDDLVYELNRPPSREEFVALLEASTLGDRRPIDDAACLEEMLAHANLVVTARQEGRLIGIARSVTDFSYCCYLSDLAVDRNLQRRGIGRALIRKTREQLGPRCSLILLSAPDAADYYPNLGFTRHPQAWVLQAGEPLS